jgi:hypothetical protein
MTILASNAVADSYEEYTPLAYSCQGAVFAVPCDWVWQPDGQWLAISCRENQDILSGIWLAELETGKLLKTTLPDNAQIRGWANPQP